MSLKNTLQVMSMLAFPRKTAFFLLLIMPGLSVFTQPDPLERGSTAFFDSLENRIDGLEKQIPRLKQARDVSYYNLQRELDLTLFARECEEFVRDEDLDHAKKLVDARIERAEFRRDKYSLEYYNRYRDDINNLIKQQRIHYQALFAKEKNFRKEFDRFVNQGTPEAYQRASRMVSLALKYARENNLAETVRNLETYDAYIRALIFDAGSSFDLATLTGSIKEFEKVFLPLVESDSAAILKKADMLVAHCTDYARLTGSLLKPEYFTVQGLRVSSAMSDLLQREGAKKDPNQDTDDGITARFDTVNPQGVYKWHDQVVVIGEFLPESAMESVKKGEAILHSDKTLSAYLKKNRLCASTEDLKFGYAFVIPYKSTVKNSSFMYNLQAQKWQYIVCYSSIGNPEYTRHVSSYMPPLLFENESDMARRRSQDE